ncbi:MAG: hypothetical protein AAGE86_03175 [Pseudomonadota bacterium]
MKNLVLSGAAAALALMVSPALASHGPGEPEFTLEPMQIYACDSGFRITVTRLQVRGQYAILVGFPTGRDDNLSAIQLLPATQTGSGVRFASDITSFHEKGDAALFRTAESAKSEAIPTTQCKLESQGHAETDKPVDTVRAP